jgi:UDP-N-acetylmuramate: L-alanyl-gamma-D-glutamyl-meso-diaminopimelate ligase
LNYHLIGIGGTGMGALAGLLKAAGHDVRGSDTAVYPPMSDQLEDLQIPVFKGFSADNLAWKPDAVVVGNVCSKDHVEVVEAKRLDLSLTSLPALLSEQFIANKHSLVVAGTHGKTTTSSLLSHILVRSGRDAGCFIGGVPIGEGRGWRHGGGEEFVVEGDEYDSAFFDKGSKVLHYRPRTAVLTSVELDHVDIFSSMEEVRRTFRKFVRLIPDDGLLLVSSVSREARAIAREASCRVETYAVRNGEPDVDGEDDLPVWLAEDLEYTKHGRCKFKLRRNGELFDHYESLLVGSHNVGNVVAAVAAAHSLGIPPDQIRTAISDFAGIQRRQEIRGIAQGVYILDDYAHHPTAVRQTLRGLRKRFSKRRLIALYEPRSATSRRKTFQKEFVDAFAHADVIVVGKPYDMSKIPKDQRFDPARLALELHQGGTKAVYIENVDDIVTHIVDIVRPGDVVAVMSSGSFEGLHQKLLAALGDAVTPARPGDMQDVRDIAAEMKLVDAGLGDTNAANFLVLRNETGFVGCVGLEVYGEDAILRSLAITKTARGVGYGWLLADTAIQVARHRGVRRIYLLTETASDFFAAKHGFRVVDLSTVGSAVSESNTFRSQRGLDAVAMRLDL